MRRGKLIAVLLAVLPTMATAQTTTYYGRTKLGNMQMKPTVRQLTTHPYWGCLPSMPDGFNAAYYGYVNTDVVEAGYPLYQHYVDYGKSEGRRPCDPSGSTTFDPSDSYTYLIARNGSQSYTATASHDRYSVPYNMVNAAVTIDGFDVNNDSLGLGWIEPQLGVPTFVDMGGGLGTALQWNGKVLIRLVGISVSDAQKIELAGRTVTS